MGLIACPECNKEISEQAETCPNCGYKIASYVQNKSFVDEFMMGSYDPYEVFLGINPSCVSSEVIDSDKDLKQMLENDIEFVSFDEIIPALRLKAKSLWSDNFEIYELETVRNHIDTIETQYKNIALSSGVYVKKEDIDKVKKAIELQEKYSRRRTEGFLLGKWSEIKKVKNKSEIRKIKKDAGKNLEQLERQINMLEMNKTRFEVVNALTGDYPTTSNVSVGKSALGGALIAGTAGAVIGAAYANDKNKENEARKKRYNDMQNDTNNRIGHIQSELEECKEQLNYYKHLVEADEDEFEQEVEFWFSVVGVRTFIGMVPIIVNGNFINESDIEVMYSDIQAEAILKHGVKYFSYSFDSTGKAVISQMIKDEKHGFVEFKKRYKDYELQERKKRKSEHEATAKELKSMMADIKNAIKNSENIIEENEKNIPILEKQIEEMKPEISKKIQECEAEYNKVKKGKEEEIAFALQVMQNAEIDYENKRNEMEGTSGIYFLKKKKLRKEYYEKEDRFGQLKAEHQRKENELKEITQDFNSQKNSIEREEYNLSNKINSLKEEIEKYKGDIDANEKELDTLKNIYNNGEIDEDRYYSHFGRHCREALYRGLTSPDFELELKHEGLSLKDKEGVKKYIQLYCDKYYPEMVDKLVAYWCE